MRIYILSNAALKKNILSKLEPFLNNTRYISYIWSLNGLLQVEDNKVYRIKIKDVMIPISETYENEFLELINHSSK